VYYKWQLKKDFTVPQQWMCTRGRAVNSCGDECMNPVFHDGSNGLQANFNAEANSCG
jgi:hypothetical protein